MAPKSLPRPTLLFSASDTIFGQRPTLSNQIWLPFRKAVKCSSKLYISTDCGASLSNKTGWFVGPETLVVEVVSSEDSVDETPNSLAELPDELISKHEAVTKDTATCKQTIKEVSEKPPKKKITHDMVLEEQYKALLLKQSNLKLNKKKLELEIALLEQKCAKIKETEACGNLMTTINLSPIVAGRSFLS